jgi:AcrR family transcriptional regulator
MAPPPSKQKERILRVAAKLFAKNGYQATGVQELGKAVGLGRGALYHHIGSKEQLLFDISFLHVEEMVELGEALLEEETSAQDKIRRLSSALMRNIVDNLDEWTVFFHEVNALTGRVRKPLIARRERYEQIWADIVAQGTRSGELRKVDPVAIKGLLGMHNYAYLWIRERGRLEPEEIADVFCDIIMPGLLASGAADERPSTPARRQRRATAGER